MTRTKTRTGFSHRSIAAIAALGLLVAACGSDDDNSSTTDADVAPSGSAAEVTEPESADVTEPESADVTEPEATATESTEAEADEAPVAESGGELTIVPAVAPTQFDPHKQVHAGEEPFFFAFYDRLTTLNDDMTVGPQLATEWEVSDDGLTLTMQIRDDVTFNDGTPFDADAVVVNFDRMQNLEESTVKRQLEMISSVEAASPTEVVFTLSTPSASLPATFSGAAGAMISPAAIAAGTDLGQSPQDAGSGPYMAESVTFGERFVLVPSPDYWDTSVTQLDKLTLELITDPATRLAALQTGEVDAIATGADPSDVTTAEQLADSGDFAYYTRPTSTLMGLMMRPTRPGIDDPAVRQAIVQAIDANAIVDGLLEGTCQASTQIYPEGTPGHIDDFDPLPYDNGESLSASGVTGPLEMVVNAGAPPFTQIAEVVQAQLQAAGLETQITPLASNEALATFRTDGTDFWMYQLTGSLDPALTVTDYILGDRFGSTSAAITDAVAAAEATSDPDERDAALQEVARAVADEAVIAPTCFLNANWLATNNVTGVEELTTPYSTFAFDVRYLGRTGD